MPKTFINELHPESNIDGFTQDNGTVKFYTFVRAAILRTNASEILDYGAGRGQLLTEDVAKISLFRRQLCDLRASGARVTACDVDPVVATHPASHQQVQIEANQPLPFLDNQFDVIVSDWTFEHIDDPAFAAAELTRVLKPGGYLCARTPNATGYIRVCSQLVPNRLHKSVLKGAQPNRREEDVFPTFYRMNSARALNRLFPRFNRYFIFDFGDPAYHFGSRWIYRAFLVMHWMLPSLCAPVLYAYMQKQST